MKLPDSLPKAAEVVESPPTRILTSSARRIARQIENRLDGHVTSGDAFVVSVYGEWGIGKTRCLEDVRLVYSSDSLTIADLSAWRPLRPTVG